MGGITDNQEAKKDEGKLRLTLVPRQIIRSIAAVRMFGVLKYTDPENWRKVSKKRYRDAAFRHFLAYLDDPSSIDEESGLPHLWHLSCNIAFLEELEGEDGTFGERSGVPCYGGTEHVGKGSEEHGQSGV